MAQARIQISDLTRLQIVSDVQIHADGSRALAAIRRCKSPSEYLTRVALLQPGRGPRFLTAESGSARMGRWIPGSDSISFIANRDDSGDQVYILPGEGGEASPLTKLPLGSISQLKWSPDGSAAAILFRESPPHRSKAAKKRREERKESEPPIETDVWAYRLDGDGYPEGTRYGLMLVDARSGKHRQVDLETDRDNIEFDWLPDGSRLLVCFSPGIQKYMEPDSSSLILLDPHSLEQSPILGLDPGEKSAVSVSPSGRLAAFIYDRIAEKKWGMRRQLIGVLDLTTGRLETFFEDSDLVLDGNPLGDARDAAPFQLFWSADESALYWAWAKEGQQRLWTINLSNGEAVDLMPDFVGEIHIGSFAQEAAAFGVWVTTPSAPNEAAILDHRGLRQLTRLNSWIQQKQLAELSEFWLPCPGEDSLQFQCWRLTPPGFDAKKKHRAVVTVHGGPMCMYSSAFFFEFQVLAAQGWVIYFCNPRGSTGYGREFCTIIEGDWGNRDWADVEALTDFAKSESFVDSSKVAIIGGSYGGFMVNWAISHSDAYDRAVTDRCVSNLLSKWGNSDYLNIPDAWWPGGAFTDSTVLWNCSPIKHFASVKTPTLVVHSEGDLRCNIEQGEQVYAALKILGVETKFIRYPRTTSHGMSRGGPPDLRQHRLAAYVDWLSR